MCPLRRRWLTWDGPSSSRATTSQPTSDFTPSWREEGRWISLFIDIIFFCLSSHTIHTTTAERRAEKQCWRRGASSGQNTRRGIEGDHFFIPTYSPRLDDNCVYVVELRTSDNHDGRGADTYSVLLVMLIVLVIS